VKSVVELEDMTEGQLKTLLAFLLAAIAASEVEEDWRETESNETLPLLRGLTHYISIELLGEVPEDERQGEDNDWDAESDELDF